MTAPFPPFPPFPPNPSIGQIFGSWVWNGNQWVPMTGGAPIINIQSFKTVGATLTYIPSPGLVTAIVECWGGGGAGGQAGPSPNVEWAMGGGGGGSGGYSRKVLPAALVLGGVVVTIGGGGNPGPITQGQPTSFGSLCVANGGYSGVGNDVTPNGAGQGAPGAAPGIGDVTLPGAGGVDGIMIWYNATQSAQLINGGIGGSVMGGGVPSSPVGQGAGVVGASAYANSGAGGSGAALNQMPAPTPTFLGGAGGTGLCVVTEYCSGSAGTGCPPGAPINVPPGACGPGWGWPC